jgi:hypothetical protein
MRTGFLAALAVASIAATGCGSTGGQLGDILGGVLNAPTANSTVTGEVTSIDTRNQQIVIRTNTNQTGYINYDNNTKVIYQNREYPVTSLEQGDLVSMTVQQANNNQVYTSQITVTQSVQDRTGTGTSTGTTSDGLQRLEGTVNTIDRTRGTFELRSGGNTTQVVLNYNASSAVRDYFSRLRTGDYVRVEGRWIGQNSISVERFY